MLVGLRSLHSSWSLAVLLPLIACHVGQVLALLDNECSLCDLSRNPEFELKENLDDWNLDLREYRLIEAYLLV